MTTDQDTLTGSALLLAARVIDDIDRQHTIERNAFEEGYRLGYQSGHEIGEAHAENELDKAWASIAISVRATVATPTWLELTARREHPGRLALDWRERHGGEHQGGAVEWALG